MPSSTPRLFTHCQRRIIVMGQCRSRCLPDCGPAASPTQIVGWRGLRMNMFEIISTRERMRQDHAYDRSRATFWSEHACGTNGLDATFHQASGSENEIQGLRRAWNLTSVATSMRHRHREQSTGRNRNLPVLSTIHGLGQQVCVFMVLYSRVTTS